MAIYRRERCMHCRAEFSPRCDTWGEAALTCTACVKAKRVRDLFGEGEIADRWIALLYPEVLEQEERQGAYVRELQEAMREKMREKA